MKVTHIERPTKSWWAGAPKVEPYLKEIYRTIDKYNLSKDAKTDIYNRAYEAVYRAIKENKND